MLKKPSRRRQKRPDPFGKNGSGGALIQRAPQLGVTGVIPTWYSPSLVAKRGETLRVAVPEVPRAETFVTP